MRITVIVPTYRRPDDLIRCLEALKRQALPPVRVVVVHSDGDPDTASRLATYDPGSLPIQIATVEGRGVVAKLNAGLDAATGDVVAMTDDDAAPRPTWLERIAACFAAHPQAGGVGGRDHIRQPDRYDDWPPETDVGVSTWYGHIYGNHHCGVGPAREVEMLKGVCMAFRRDAIGCLRFDTRLRGRGAQVGNEFLFGAAIRKAGWSLVYDPSIGVEHYPAPRPDSDYRGQIDEHALRDMVFNQTLGWLEYMPRARTVAVLLRSVLRGSRQTPGIVTGVWFHLRGHPQALFGFVEVLRGQRDAWRVWRRDRGEHHPERTAAARPGR